MDVENYFKEGLKSGGTLSSAFKYDKCESSDEEKGLFCIKKDFPHLVYFYFPIQKAGWGYINQSINFSCNKADNGKQCVISNYL